MENASTVMIYGFEMKALVISVLLAGGLSAASDSGEVVYGQRCARCHELNNPRGFRPAQR